MIQESARGQVYLEQVSTGQVYAAHPIRFASHLIAKVLEGVVTLNERDRQAAPELISEEIAVLPPTLAEGLRRTTANHQIGSQKGICGCAPLPDSYSLYLPLPPSRQQDVQPGQHRSQLHFFPETARRSGVYAAVVAGQSGSDTLGSHYEVLANTPTYQPPVAIPARQRSLPVLDPAPTTPADSQQLNDAMSTKDMEVEEIRRKLQENKRMVGK